MIEKLTTGNVATNGETEFHHVFMKALPNMSGTTVSFVHDQPQTLTLTADLSSTHVEEMDDLAVVILVQNPANKKVMQATYTESSGIQMGTSDVVSAQIALVPNPSTGIVHVLTDKAVDLKVIDLTGRSVFAQKSVKNNATLDLSHLGKGVYVVQFQNEEGSVVAKKLILK